MGKVRDARAFEAGKILFACSVGLRLFDEKSGTASECPLVPPKGEVVTDCRDGRGRIWRAGSSVWMVDAKGTVHDLGKLNRSGVTAHAIGADSTHATGVIVALDRRVVLLLYAEDAGGR